MDGLDPAIYPGFNKVNHPRHRCSSLPLLLPFAASSPSVSVIPAGRVILSPSIEVVFMLKHELVNEMNELSALKTVIKRIEEQYPIDPLQKHIVQLEKSKADKKRAAEAAKPQSKRTHASGCIYVPRITSMPDKASTEHTLRDFLIHMTGSMSRLSIVII
ncbi:hypothetical protein C4D60_Mb06t29420 [Musa balbisiana]|uniref:FRIGIDA-like protein n=1 Tax=Musa balbisiana TaxID=52838 RepID=A0A4S8IRJ4_MUSBA|nr:hypothetical protein C4D60_Mb06t29420 [Musa balbisiana]